MRLIDKDKLMEKLEIAEDCDNCKHNHHSIYCGMGSEFVTACEAICEAPEVDIPHWIPCSERLPEEEDYYLVTKEDDIAYSIDIALWNPHYHWSNNGFHKADKVIAWQPLPEPYQQKEVG